jgi:hypothetical protein
VSQELPSSVPVADTGEEGVSDLAVDQIPEAQLAAEPEPPDESRFQ